MRFAILLVLVGCSTPPPPKEEPKAASPLDALEAASLRIERFHALYGLRDEGTGEEQIFELAYRGPQSAKLVSAATNQTLIFRDGACRLVTPSYKYEIPYLAEYRGIQERYGAMIRIADEITKVGVGRAPQLAFDFELTRPQLTYTTAQTRFLWLQRLRDPAWVWDGKLSFRRDGEGGKPSMEIELDEQGFLVRMRILPERSRGYTLERKSVRFEPLADEVFAPPASDATDVSAQRLEKLRSTIADHLLRTILEALSQWKFEDARGTELFVAWYRVDLERTYEPKRAVELVRAGQDKWVADAREKGMDRKELLEKLKIQRATALGQVEDIEERLRETYRRLLKDSLLKGLPREFGEKVLEISNAGLAKVIEEDLRAHVRASFDGHIAAVEKE